MLLQKHASGAEKISDHRPGRTGKGGRRECGRGGCWGWSGLGLQDRVPQSSQRSGAFSGSCHWGGRNSARYLHHGCTSGSLYGFVAVWQTGSERGGGETNPFTDQGRGRGHFPLRKLCRRADGGRRVGFGSRLRRESIGECFLFGNAPARSDPERRGQRSRESGLLCGRQDGTRWFGRSCLCLTGSDGRKQGGSAGGSGGGSVCRETSF